MGGDGEVTPPGAVTPTNEIGGLTITQAAAILRVHPNTVRKRIKDGSLPSQRVLTPNGLVYVIPREAVEGAWAPTTEVNPAAIPALQAAIAEQLAAQEERLAAMVTAVVTPLQEAHARELAELR